MFHKPLIGLMQVAGVYDSNKKLFTRPEIGAHYARRNFLHASEEFILEAYEAAIRGGAILDVGVGGGRTAPALAALAGRYVGIDYSREMIKQCRALYPQLDFRHSDAMNLTDFADDEFDLVFFSANGLDYVTLAERLRMIEELRRVLRPGGLFVFSSRNLHRSAKRNPYRFKGFVFAANPLRLLRENLKRGAGYLRGIYNFQRRRKYEVRGDGYALLAEPIHHFATVMYCSTMEFQIAQLERLGFDQIRVVSFGKLVDDVGAELDDPWLYYVASKAPRAAPES